MYIYSKDFNATTIDLFCTTTPPCHRPARMVGTVDVIGTKTPNAPITSKGARTFVDDKDFEILKKNSLYQSKVESGIYYLDAEKLEEVAE